MAPSNPKSTSKLRFALHFRYSIVIEAGLGFPLSIFIFAQHSRICFSYIFTEYLICFTLLNAIDNINRDCEYVIIRRHIEHIMQDIPENILG